MRSVTVINTTTGSVHVQETGRPGPAGLVWQDGGWLPDTRYQRNWALYHDGTSYRALVEHVSTAETEPGVGADWETVWQALALGSDVEDVETVAGIAAEIVAVAAIKDDVTAVASIRDEVAIVAARDADIATVAARDAAIATVAARAEDIGKVAAIDAEVGQVAAVQAQVAVVASVADDVETLAPVAPAIQEAADNMLAILAAPSAASAAAHARDKAEAWADADVDVPVEEDPDRFSARHYATKAAASASTAAAANRIAYEWSIYDDTEIPVGSYYARRRAGVASIQTELYAEIINGPPGSYADFYIEVGGIIASGPHVVEFGTPLFLDDLTVAIAEADGVNVVITSRTDDVREVSISLLGAVS